MPAYLRYARAVGAAPAEGAAEVAAEGAGSVAVPPPPPPPAAPPADDRPLYLFERRFCELAPRMAREFDVPPHFADDLTRYLAPSGLRPDHRWLIAGPRRSGSAFHKDPNASSAWNALVRGRKAWVFYPPGSTPPGVVVGGEFGSDVATPASVMEWYVDFFAQHRRRLRAGGADAPLCGVQEPGDVVFVPAGWWHQVLNLEDSVAVTHNFVSPRNLAGALGIFRDDPAAVAGVAPGREAEVFGALVAALRRERPELIAALAGGEADDAPNEATAAAAEEEAAGGGPGAGPGAGPGPAPARRSWASVVADAVGKGGGGGAEAMTFGW
jgi:hypothetical protein